MAEVDVKDLEIIISPLLDLTEGIFAGFAHIWKSVVSKIGWTFVH